MATGTAGSVARQYHTAQVHYLRRDFTFAATTAVSLTVGIIPGGSLIIKPMSGVFVSTVFNYGTNNLLDVGISGDTDLWGTDLSLLAAVFVPLDEAVGGFYVAADTTILATPDVTGTAGTTGRAQVVICYIPSTGVAEN